MEIYCDACNVCHHLTNGEAEQLIYVLQAELAEGRDPEVSKDPISNTLCLQAHLSGATDSEMYLEHVEAFVEIRRNTKVTY